jgi:YidC/Oxa1 family membrane protein insertase
MAPSAARGSVFGESPGAARMAAAASTPFRPSEHEMIVASFYTTAITPFAKLFGWLLAAFYSATGNYGIAIVLLTLVTMVVVFPLTRKGTRSMMQMQLLQPELLKMRGKYKKKAGMTPEERREQQSAQQEEMMALYRENGVSPTGGCLPMFMQFPVFIVLYNTIRGMTHTTTEGIGKAAHLVATPEFIDVHTRLYHNLTHSGGKMEAFGLNLADSVRSHQSHLIDVLPYLVVILIAVALQYVSIWQITNRNPTAGANQQMQQIQKFMPLIFVVIYIEFPAGVGLYFIVSSMFRIGQQEWMYKRDPHITAAVGKLREMKLKNPPPVTSAPKTFRERLAALAPSVEPSLEPSEEAARNATKPIRKPAGGSRPRQSGRPSSSSKTGNSQAARNGTRGVKSGQSSKTGSSSRNGPSTKNGQSPKSGQSPKAGQSGRSGQVPKQGAASAGGASGSSGTGNGSGGPARPKSTGTAPAGSKSMPAQRAGSSGSGVNGNGAKQRTGRPISNGGAQGDDPTPAGSDPSPPRRRGRPR